MKKCERCNGTGYISEKLPRKDDVSVEGHLRDATGQYQTVELSDLCDTTCTESELADYRRKKALRL